MTTDDPLDQNEDALDASTFLEWLDETAKSEGRTRQELLETLVTSYWTLDEMLHLLEQTDPDSGLSLASSQFGGGDDARLDRLSDVETDLADRIDDLDERIRDLRGDHRARETPEEAFADRLEAVDERVARLERTLPEAGGSSEAAERELDALAGQLRAFETSIESRHETLNDRVNEEFSHLRTIIEHLLSKTDEVDDRTLALLGRFDGEVRQLVAESDRLTDVKRSAARLGVSEAKCEYCSTTVDIALLPTPYCPQCERLVEGVEPKRGWFGSPTLRVTDRPLLEAPRESNVSGSETTDADDARDSATGVSGGSDRIGGFVWGSSE